MFFFKVAWHNVPRGFCIDLHTKKQLDENRETIMVAHFVAGNKMKRILDLGLHFVNASCSHFSVAVDLGLIAKKT